MEALETAGIVVAIVVLSGVRTCQVVRRVRRVYERLRPIRPEDREGRRRERAERRRARETSVRRYGPRDQP